MSTNYSGTLIVDTSRTQTSLAGVVAEIATKESHTCQTIDISQIGQVEKIPSNVIYIFKAGDTETLGEHDAYVNLEKIRVSITNLPQDVEIAIVLQSEDLIHHITEAFTSDELKRLSIFSPSSDCLGKLMRVDFSQKEGKTLWEINHQSELKTYLSDVFTYRTTEIKQR